MQMIASASLGNQRDVLMQKVNFVVGLEKACNVWLRRFRYKRHYGYPNHRKCTFLAATNPIP